MRRFLRVAVALAALLAHWGRRSAAAHRGRRSAAAHRGRRSAAAPRARRNRAVAGRGRERLAQPDRRVGGRPDRLHRRVAVRAPGRRPARRSRRRTRSCRWRRHRGRRGGSPGASAGLASPLPLHDRDVSSRHVRDPDLGQSPFDTSCAAQVACRELPPVRSPCRLLLYRSAASSPTGIACLLCGCRQRFAQHHATSSSRNRWGSPSWRLQLFRSCSGASTSRDGRGGHGHATGRAKAAGHHASRWTICVPRPSRPMQNESTRSIG